MTRDRYGIALDIGTSNIEGLLVDLRKRKALEFDSVCNTQLPFGQDVVSRLNFARSRQRGLKRLNERIISDIGILINLLVRTSGLKGRDVNQIICVGNSTMHHLVLGISPDTLAIAPFRPSHVAALFRTKANSIGLDGFSEADFEFLPNIGGFVGSDAIAVIVSSGIYRSRCATLAIDIGTNGEVILGNRERILVASTSAGPAFEGWHISCGMPAVNGAIESVEMNQGRLAFKTIGNVEPKGLCGSGLIDILRIMLKHGIVSRSGELKCRRFNVYKGLYVTQEDIRQLQLAKAAIRACIEILRKKFNKKIGKLIITGRFGNNISRRNAKAIGIIPKGIDLRKVHLLRHGPLEGAKTIMCSESLKRSTVGLHRRIVHVELHKEKDFQEEFINSMRF